MEKRRRVLLPIMVLDVCHEGVVQVLERTSEILGVKFAPELKRKQNKKK